MCLLLPSSVRQWPMGHQTKERDNRRKTSEIKINRALRIAIYNYMYHMDCCAINIYILLDATRGSDSVSIAPFICAPKQMCVAMARWCVCVCVWKYMCVAAPVCVNWWQRWKLRNLYANQKITPRRVRIFIKQTIYGNDNAIVT